MSIQCVSIPPQIYLPISCVSINIVITLRLIDIYITGRRYPWFAINHFHVYIKLTMHFFFYTTLIIQSDNKHCISFVQLRLQTFVNFTIKGPEVSLSGVVVTFGFQVLKISQTIFVNLHIIRLVVTLSI